VKHSYRNIREFIASIESKGELLRIRDRVSPFLEIAEITDRASKSPEGGKALLFEQVEGSEFPVITNAFGSPRRICLALGVDDLDELGSRLKEIVDVAPPRTFRDKVRLARNAARWARFLPKTAKVSSPPCQQVIVKRDDVDLRKLPILHSWPKDAGPFVTLPVVITKSLSGRRNVGMYRMQVFDRNTMGMHWHIHKDGARCFREYERAGKRMEVAVAIGTDPAVTYAATAPLPPGIDEMILAGFIRQEPVTLVKGVTVDIEVPVESEFVLEGYIDPGERRMEGPFGDHTGFYTTRDEYPVIHITAITHRKDAIYSATVVGRPPMEDCYLARATERIFLPPLQTLLPEIADCHMPVEGVFHNLVLVSIKKEYPGQSSKVMHGLWGSGQMSFCKTIIVLDAAIRPSDPEAVISTLLDAIDLETDLLPTKGILDVLDHASAEALHGGKVGIDATHRIDGEVPRPARAPSRDPLSMDTFMAALTAFHDIFLDCRILYPEAAHPLILFTIRKQAGTMKKVVEALLSSPFLPARCIMVIFETPITASNSELLWRACANVDPARDFYLRRGRLVIDATAKTEGRTGGRPWPEEIAMSAEVKERVGHIRTSST
jgi:4-hydroxy-3-polyprenylbenzoate decarboxylase